MGQVPCALEYEHTPYSYASMRRQSAMWESTEWDGHMKIVVVREKLRVLHFIEDLNKSLALYSYDPEMLELMSGSFSLTWFASIEKNGFSGAEWIKANGTVPKFSF